MYILGLSYFNGVGLKQNYALAVQWYKRAADLGHSRAQYALSYCYDRGEAVEKNAVKAAMWSIRAAEQGFAKAQYALSNCYRTGDGVGVDIEASATWLKKAADNGDKRAQYNLGLAIEQGREPFESDLSEAIQWYRKAAEQQYPPAVQRVSELQGRLTKGAGMDSCLGKRLAPAPAPSTAFDRNEEESRPSRPPTSPGPRNKRVRAS